MLCELVLTSFTLPQFSSSALSLLAAVCYVVQFAPTSFTYPLLSGAHTWRWPLTASWHLVPAFTSALGAAVLAPVSSSQIYDVQPPFCVFQLLPLFAFCLDELSWRGLHVLLVHGVFVVEGLLPIEDWI